ncbi:MAG: crotonase/enoyl-CoA hydratase family protein [Alphaproteobacteria bacterium]|nr:MAG: crotonase/enoyl-CoA hydratase family protein [Alphaproteobacteria bacterium]
MSERVKITIKDGVADVRLVRSDKMNALDDAMFEGLIAAAEQVSTDPTVRCVVISGEGRAFCAGLDMGNMAAIAGSGGDSEITRQPLAIRTHGITNRPQQAVWAWRDCPVPVIAAVHGVAFGGGFQLSLGADIRITHPDTKMSIMEIKWGLVPDMAGTAIMRHLVRDDLLRELTYTGRVFSGTQGLEYGFVTQLSDDPHATAMEMAQTIAKKNPQAIRGDKLIFNSINGMTDAEALMQESVLQDGVIGTANQAEAVMAELQKRDPVFEDGA